MTSNQIAAASNAIQREANAATQAHYEREDQNNVVRNSIQESANQETIRHDKEVESIQHQINEINAKSQAEVERHNKTVEQLEAEKLQLDRSELIIKATDSLLDSYDAGKANAIAAQRADIERRRVEAETAYKEAMTDLERQRTYLEGLQTAEVSQHNRAMETYYTGMLGARTRELDISEENTRLRNLELKSQDAYRTAEIAAENYKISVDYLAIQNQHEIQLRNLLADYQRMEIDMYNADTNRKRANAQWFDSIMHGLSNATGAIKILTGGW